jgi:5-methylcytosine-specific restriction endonuclease McrA
LALIYKNKDKEYTMKTSDKLIKFYHSAKWYKVRDFVRYDRRGICERCGEPGQEVHHTIKLTDENVDDPMISLNPDKLVLLCTRCHNAQRNLGGNIRADIGFDAMGNVIRKKTPPGLETNLWGNLQRG